MDQNENLSYKNIVKKETEPSYFDKTGKINCAINLRDDLPNLEQQDAYSLNNKLKNEQILSLADDYRSIIDTYNNQGGPQSSHQQQALKTQEVVYGGVYNSTGMHEEIDEKVFISHSKKSPNRDPLNLNDADLNKGTQSGTAQENFLNMECDQSNDGSPDEGGDGGDGGGGKGCPAGQQ